MNLIIDGKIYSISEEVKRLMVYLDEIETIEGKKLSNLSIPNIHEKQFTQILQACRIVNNEFRQITKIKLQNQCTQYIGRELYSYFETFSSHCQLNKLYKTANFFKMKNLKLGIAAYLSFKIVPSKINVEKVEEKKKELGLKKEQNFLVDKKKFDKYMFM